MANYDDIGLEKTQSLKNNTKNLIDNSTSWINNSFSIGRKTLKTKQISDLTFIGTADSKWTTGALGSSMSINPKPQNSRVADPPLKGLFTNREDVNVFEHQTDLGQGEYWSMALDDNAKHIYLTFGQAKHNSLASFLKTAVSYDASVLANNGSSNLIGRLVRGVLQVSVFAAFPLMSLVYLSSKNLLTYLGLGNSKFYSLEPKMPLYMSMVTSLVNHMGTNLGIIPTYETTDEIVSGRRGDAVSDKVISPSDLEYLHSIMPNVISKKGAISITNMISRPQKIFNKFKDSREAIINEGYNSGKNVSDIYKELSRVGPEDIDGNSKEIEEILREHLEGSELMEDSTAGAGGGILDSLAGIFGGGSKNTSSESPGSNSENSATKKKSGTVATSSILRDMSSNTKYDKDPGNGKLSYHKDTDIIKNEGWFKKLLSNSEVAYEDGTQFLVLEVDNTKDISDSVTNSTGSGGIKDKLNSISSTARNFKFNLSNGNISDGLLGSIAETVAGTIGNIAGETGRFLSMGMSTSLQAVLSGNAKIDVPDKWTDTDVSFNSSTYKISLVSPSDDPIARLINIYIPICCILAGVLPVSTGRQSYTSPLLCSLFDRGCSIIPIGLVTSVNFVRGVGSMPFNKEGAPLSVDVNIGITNLSKMMHAPISSGSLLSRPDANFDENTPLYDWLYALSGSSLQDLYYKAPKLERKVYNSLKNADLAFNAGYIGSRLGDYARQNTIGRVLSAFSDVNEYTK